MEWPGNSPDMNPIENVWSHIAHKIRERQPNSLKELKETIERVWYDDIKLEYIEKLYESMTRRVTALLKAKGGPTKY